MTPATLAGRVANLVELVVPAPGVVEAWPTFLYHDIRRRLGRPGSPSATTIDLRDGSRLGVVAGSSGLYPIFSEVYLHRRYDGRDGFAIAPTDTVIDIGAQVGFFTVKAARAASAGRVLSFEPCPPHVTSLEANVARNQLANVTVLPEAMWSDDGEISIRYSMKAGQPNHTSVFDIGGTTSAQVRSVSLDTVFAREGVDRCQLMKFDCEGAEYAILGAASDDTLRRIDASRWNGTPSIRPTTSTDWSPACARSASTSTHRPPAPTTPATCTPDAPERRRAGSTRCGAAVADEVTSGADP